MFANLYSSFYNQYFAKNFLCRLSLKDVEDRINGLIMARVRYLYLHAATMRQRAHAAMRQRANTRQCDNGFFGQRKYEIDTVYWTVENSLIPWVRGGFCWQRTTTVAQKNVNAQTVDWYRMSTQEPLPDVKLRLSRTYVKCYHIINAQTGKKNAAFEHVNFGRQLKRTSTRKPSTGTKRQHVTSQKTSTQYVLSIGVVKRRC